MNQELNECRVMFQYTRPNPGILCTIAEWLQSNTEPIIKYPRNTELTHVQKQLVEVSLIL